MRLKVDTLANLAIIVLSIVVSGILIKNNFLSRPEASVEIEVGQSLDLPPAVSFEKSNATLVVALAPDCRFCTDSLPFYKSLLALRDSTGAAFRIVGLVKDSGEIEEERGILASSGVRLDMLITADFQSVGIPGTPTLLLVDRQGEVLDVWHGRQGDVGEKEVLRQLGLT